MFRAVVFLEKPPPGAANGITIIFIVIIVKDVEIFKYYGIDCLRVIKTDSI